jgi:hypothetical protein
MKPATIETLREYLREVLLSERGKKTPGGPRTDAGALRQLNPSKFKGEVRAAVDASKGSVPKAAKAVGVATRTMYYYLDDEPGLSDVKTAEERAADKEEKKPAEK